LANHFVESAASQIGTPAVPDIFITPRQIRAARGLVGWTQHNLAEAAGLSRATIAAVEKDGANPTPDVRKKIMVVFEEAQVEFLSQEGVRLRGPTIFLDDQPGANRRLLDDIFSASSEFNNRKNVNEILIFGLREEDSELSVGDFLLEHIERLQQAGLREKILCASSTRTFVAPISWYRRLSALNPTQTPIHIYAEKVALVQWKPKELVFVVENREIAEAVRAMFNHIWDSQREISARDGD
jgi:DNA-binding XRE family transcriptional regulator